MEIVIAAIIVLGISGFGAWQAYRMKKASSAELTDDECVACGSHDIEFFNPGVYRCNKCGYEGGSGMKAMQDKAHEDALRAMDPVERWSSGLKDLQQAKILLDSAQQALERAHDKSLSDVVGMSLDDGDTKRLELTSGLGDLYDAHRHVKDASVKLELGLGDMDVDIDFSSPGFALDVQLDTFIGELSVHLQINKARTFASNLGRAVEGALSQL